MAMPRQNFSEEEIPSPLLPQDMIEEILSRMPASCLNKLKLVSKSVKSLITSPSFVRLQFDRSSEQRILISTRHGFRSLDTSFCEQFDLDFSPETVKIIGSCGGLVAFALKTNNNFYLWNPSTGEYKKFPYPYFQSTLPLPWLFNPFYGLGYESSIDDYKLVMVITQIQEVVFIFSWRKNTWTSTKLPPNIEPISHEQNRLGTFVNGALHWLQGKGSSAKILAFDLQSEQFSILQTPLFGSRPPPVGTLYAVQRPYPRSIGVVDGRLCLAGSTYYSVEMWVMKEYGVKESWANLLYAAGKIDDLFYHPIWKSENHHIVGTDLGLLKFDHERRSTVERCFVGRKGKHVCQAILVTDSLVSPIVEHQRQEQIGKGKRKREEEKISSNWETEFLSFFS